MATFKLLKSEVKPLTRELAATFREMEPSPTERELNPQRIRHLREKAEAGLLVNFQWATAKLGDKTFRVNGNHSSNMLCDLNGEFPVGLYAHIDAYEVDDQQGLAQLFRQFDDKKSGRSSADVAGAYQNLEPDLRSLDRKIAKMGIDGYAFYCRHISGKPVPGGDSVYTLFNEDALHPYLIWLNEVLSMKTPEMQRVPVIAALYGTWIENSDAAADFWQQVASGGKDEENHPTALLDDWLTKAKKGEVAEELKPIDLWQACIYAWNMWRKERQITEIKHAHKNVLKPVG